MAIVTGASRGIGQGIALRLAQCGADVALIALNDAAGLSETAKQVEAAGRRALTYDADVADERRAEEIVQDVVQQLGSLQILVNNAGAGQPKGLLELSTADWRRTLAVNLDSAFYWSRAAAPHLLAAGWGRIIMISSMSGKNGGGGPPFSVSKSAYAAAKAGLLGLTRGLALELGPHGTTVNAVCPGPIYTTATQNIMSGTKGEAYAKQVPVRRLGKPDDIAAAVAFLCAPEADFITGECMDVNGGFYID